MNIGSLWHNNVYKKFRIRNRCKGPRRLITNYHIPFGKLMHPVKEKYELSCIYDSHGNVQKSYIKAIEDYEHGMEEHKDESRT